jgi:hypothetical protein
VVGLRPPSFIWNNKITLFLASRDFRGTVTPSIIGTTRCRIEYNLKETRASSGSSATVEGFIIAEANPLIVGSMNEIEGFDTDTIRAFGFRPNNWFAVEGDHSTVPSQSQEEYMKIKAIKKVMSHNNLSHFEIEFTVTRSLEV